MKEDDAAEWVSPFIQVDLGDYGATFAAAHGYDATVHLAGQPAPDRDHATGARRARRCWTSPFMPDQSAWSERMGRVGRL